MLINKTTNTIVARKVKICRSFLAKTVGLMFHKKSDAAYIFVFDKPKNLAIHTFFVFFPIYIMLLDKRKKILCIKHLKPFKVFYPNSNFVYFIETCFKPKAKVGHLLDW